MSGPAGAERAERLVAELRDTVREAAGVLKDLRAAIRDGHVMIENYAYHQVQDALNQYTAQVQQLAEQFRNAAQADITRIADQAQQITLRNEVNRQVLDMVRESLARVLDEQAVRRAAGKRAPGAL